MTFHLEGVHALTAVAATCQSRRHWRFRFPGWVLESYLEDGVLKGPPIKYTRPRLTNDLKCLTAKSTSWDLKIW